MPNADPNGRRLNDTRLEVTAANIVVFPTRDRAVADVSSRDMDNAAAKLSQALLALNNAVAEQQETVRIWHWTIKLLAGRVQVLAGNVCALEAALTELETGRVSERHGALS